ncbi:DUF2242 domain-containing protein [Pelomonas sp. KK5]|uniref:DUF2242 domain-containing protein n=1 Tax=Pelomonas sp. KK5 TaxID=1855730 RepID=UPI00097BD82D|nr:DUF2242 domain-containing protein [Pelomonas sp. KK5]
MSKFPAAAGLALLLAGCMSNPLAPAPKAVYQSERFQSDETFSRLFDSSVEDTCEAARRALLSQGYIINASATGQITGSKRFQPNGEDHVEINFTVVCVPDGKGNAVSTAYVSAQQDRYVIKRSANSASVGVGAIGSISVPLSSSQDSLVKVASETIPAGEFYDRFFALMSRMLKEQLSDKG